MALEVYLDFSKMFLEKSKNSTEELKSVYYDESSLLLFKALTCTDKPEVQKSIKQSILSNFNYNSKSIQDQILQLLSDEPMNNKGAPLSASKQPSMQPSMQPSTKSNDIEASVEHCRVKKILKVKWSDIVINNTVKQNILQDVIEPLKLHRGRLQGVMPGHLLGKQY